MILGIRSDSIDASVVLAAAAASSFSVIDRIDWPAGRQLSATLITKIEELLLRNHKNWSNLNGIVVYQGPGSFTGLRIGITVANTMAYVLNIPVVGANAEAWLDAAMITSEQFRDIVMPHYGAEPNITRPKS